MPITRAQAKRAVQWADYLAKPRLKRAKKGIPRCLTCGSESVGMFAKGEPLYSCRHEPVTLEPGTLERARREFGRESGRD